MRIRWRAFGSLKKQILSKGLRCATLVVKKLKLLPRAKEKRTFTGCILVGVGTVDGIGSNALCVQAANGSLGCFGGIGSANQGAKIFNRVVFFQDGSNNGTGGHVLHQLAVEGTFLMNGVEQAGLVQAQLLHLQCDDAKSSLVNFGKNSSDVSVCDAVGLDHGKSSVGSH